jgi:uncharacterized damage-inducible protein DinB
MANKHYDIELQAGLEPQVGALLATLEDTTKEWCGEIKGVRPGKEAVVWQPFPNGHSIGVLILHMADVEAFWLHQVAAGRTLSPQEERRLLSSETEQYAVRWPAPPRQTLAWYLAIHDEIRARTREIVASINDPEHAGTYGSNTFTLRWLLNHVITHEAYHGGQAVLLGLMYRRR